MVENKGGNTDTQYYESRCQVSAIVTQQIPFWKCGDVIATNSCWMARRTVTAIKD